VDNPPLRSRLTHKAWTTKTVLSTLSTASATRSKINYDDKIISKDATNNIFIADTKWKYLVHLKK